ncbi:MAG TPA: hypothetical protein VFN55_19020 [Solirubrobacteraceae bacterium]|nr:hypothetical protein [Solirubrobacteraceae bacterium]
MPSPIVTPPDGGPAPARPRRARAPGAYLPLSLAARFTLAFAVAIALLAAMVIFVSGHNTDSSPLVGGPGVQRANSESDTLIAQDQAPRTVRLRGAVAPRAAIEAAVRGRMAQQIRFGSISGPLGAVRCHPTGRGGGTRRGFDCTAVSAGMRYLFAGVVQTAGRQITYCKRDLPPSGAPAVPVSPRCRS